MEAIGGCVEAALIAIVLLGAVVCGWIGVGPLCIDVGGTTGPPGPAIRGWSLPILNSDSLGPTIIDRKEFRDSEKALWLEGFAQGWKLFDSSADPFQGHVDSVIPKVYCFSLANPLSRVWLRANIERTIRRNSTSKTSGPKAHPPAIILLWPTGFCVSLGVSCRTTSGLRTTPSTACFLVTSIVDFLPTSAWTLAGADLCRLFNWNTVGACYNGKLENKTTVIGKNYTTVSTT